MALVSMLSCHNVGSQSSSWSVNVMSTQTIENMIGFYFAGSHHFHMECIQQWAHMGDNKCPLCRTPFDHIADVAHGQVIAVEPKKQAIQHNPDLGPGLHPSDDRVCHVCQRWW
jgi:hypothetical protein